MRYVVLGAAGFIGVNLVEHLLRDGISPICVRRRRTNVLRLRSLGAEMAIADLGDVASLRAAMRGADVVLHCAGHYPRYSDDLAGTIALGTTELQNVLDAAALEDVRRLVYVSSTATVAPVHGRAASEDDVFASTPGFGVYHDLKWHLEALALRERRVEVITLCPAACLGPWDLRVGTSALLVAMARGLRPPYPEGIVSTVDVRDVAEAIAKTAAIEGAPKRLLLSAESHQMSALVQRLGARYGTHASEPLSADTARAIADDGEAKARAGGGRSPIARELVDLIVHGPVIDAARSRALLDLSYRPLDETLDAFDAWARSLKIIPGPTGLAKQLEERRCT